MGSLADGKVILVSRAIILKNVVSCRADSAPVYVADIVRMTGEAFTEEGNH